MVAIRKPAGYNKYRTLVDTAKWVEDELVVILKNKLNITAMINTVLATIITTSLTSLVFFIQLI